MNREEIKSMKYMVQNNITKSLDYDLRDNLVEIKGNLLKEKLSAFLVNLLLEKNLKFRELEILSKEIGIPPQQTLDEYETKGFRNRLQTIPYKYDYSVIYPQTQDGEIHDQLSPSKHEKADLMCKYNDKVRCYVDLSVDAILIKTIFDSVDDKKVYPLKLQFASKIGL